MRFGMVRPFPTEWARECMKTYENDHGKKPKLMVVSNEDWLDYFLSNTLKIAQDTLGIRVITGDHLNKGEVDFAMGIKDGKH